MGPVLIVDLAAVRRPDLGHVDALARLLLVTKRLGIELLVTNTPAELRALIDFVGLPVEMRRQPECRKQLGIQEVVQPGDPPA